MEISSGMIKGLAATGSASACCAGGIYAYNSSKGAEALRERKENRKDNPSLTKFDRALMDYLDEGHGDILFESGNYSVPNILQSGIGSQLELKVKITGDLKEKEHFKGLNGGEDWTWSCKIWFFYSSSSGIDSEISENTRNSIGEFLKYLKEPRSTDKKIKFIEGCAKLRTDHLNREIEKLNKLSDTRSHAQVRTFTKGNELTSGDSGEIVYLVAQSDGKLSFEKEDILKKRLGIE